MVELPLSQSQQPHQNSKRRRKNLLRRRKNRQRRRKNRLRGRKNQLRRTTTRTRRLSHLNNLSLQRHRPQSPSPSQKRRPLRIKSRLPKARRRKKLDHNKRVRLATATRHLRIHRRISSPTRARRRTTLPLLLPPEVNPRRLCGHHRKLVQSHPRITMVPPQQTTKTRRQQTRPNRSKRNLSLEANSSSHSSSNPEASHSSSNQEASSSSSSSSNREVRPVPSTEAIPLTRVRCRATSSNSNSKRVHLLGTLRPRRGRQAHPGARVQTTTAASSVRHPRSSRERGCEMIPRR